jgi:hypothetical protein
MQETWLVVPRPGQEGWPWCVAEYLLTIHTTFGKPFPYKTASVALIAGYARVHGLTVGLNEAMPGDALCLGGDHITILVSRDRTRGTFVGLGGNQSHAVRESEYAYSRVTTVISTAKVAAYLGLPAHPKPPKRPLYEVVRSVNGHRQVVMTTPQEDEAFKRAKKVLAGPAKVVTIRERFRKSQ